MTPIQNYCIDEPCSSFSLALLISVHLSLTASSVGTEIHGESGLALRNGSLPPTDLQPIPGKAVLVMYERMWTHKQQRWGWLTAETVSLHVYGLCMRIAST